MAYYGSDDWYGQQYMGRPAGQEFNQAVPFTGGNMPGGDPYGGDVLRLPIYDNLEQPGGGGRGRPKPNPLTAPELSLTRFQAPDPANLQADPGYQFRLGAGQQALERSAAARGVLRTGGTLKDILQYGQNFGSQEYGNAFNRAMQEAQLLNQQEQAEFDPRFQEFQMRFQRQGRGRGGGGGGLGNIPPPPMPMPQYEY